MSDIESPASPVGGPSVAPKSAPKPARGVSVFPAARVSRIIKTDHDVDNVSKEASFLISVATEIFIKKLTDDAYTNAKLDKRKHVMYRDLSRAVQQVESLEFLKDAIPTQMALSAALGEREGKLRQKQVEENMILEGTLQDEDEEEEEEEEDEDEGEEEAGEEDVAAIEEAEVAPKAPKKKPPSHKKKATPKEKEQAPAAAGAQDDDEAMDDATSKNVYVLLPGQNP